MDCANLKLEIEEAWEERASGLGISNKSAIHETLKLLDEGKIRVAERFEKSWITHEWIKKAILLSFAISENHLIVGESSRWFDKVELKFSTWNEDDFISAGIRAVPGSVVRHSAYIGSSVVLMPSFVNVGAYIDSGTMVDTWATIGSCAQIGKNCHISGGVGIGGVLEPLQSNPVIIEDGCFIGARSEIAEGVIVKQGSVISMGVFIGASTKIYNRMTGETTYGVVPEYSVVIPGTLPSKDTGGPSLSAAIIVKTVDERTRSKTSLNELLRV